MKASGGFHHSVREGLHRRYRVDRRRYPRDLPPTRDQESDQDDGEENPVHRSGLGGLLSGGSDHACRQNDQSTPEVKHIEFHADAEEVAIDQRNGH